MIIHPPKRSRRFLIKALVEIRQGSKLHIDINNGQIHHKDNVDHTSPSDSIVNTARLFFLPRATVTSDYLNYQLWTVPAHITGWLSTSLATSSLLKAVGLGSGPVGVVGMSYAIKWLTRDGIGALGRLFVGSRLNSVFDEDPRRWRMYAEFITTAGLALEILTQLSPGYFIALAGAGNLTKSIGKGMGRPCFRVIQTYFSSVSNNVGDVAAREELWEVTAQLLGLIASVAVLKTLETMGTPEAVIPVWAGVHSIHVAMRYRGLLELRFPFLNQKRAAYIVTQYIERGTVPGIEDTAVKEPLLAGPTSVRPSAHFGCSVEDLLHGSLFSLTDLLSVYQGEKYLLTWSSSSRSCRVVLWQSATHTDALRALLQAAWLDKHAVDDCCIIDAVKNMQENFDGFVECAEKQGWQLQRTVVADGGVRISGDADG